MSAKGERRAPRGAETHLHLGEGEHGEHGDTLFPLAIFSKGDVESPDYGKPSNGMLLGVMNLRPALGDGW